MDAVPAPATSYPTNIHPEDEELDDVLELETDKEDEEVLLLDELALVELELDTLVLDEDADVDEEEVLVLLELWSA